MRLIFPEGYRYACQCCGRCCSGWNIHVDEYTANALKRTPPYQNLLKKAIDPLIQDGDDGTYSTARLPGGDCIFLSVGNLCAIHRDVEYSAKPLGCRQFPFKIRHTPDGAVVGLSFYCPSVMANTGEPVEIYQDEIRSWIYQHKYRSTGDKPLLFDDTLQVDWNGYKSLEGYIRSCLFQGADVPQALWEAEKTVLLISLLHSKSETSLLDAARIEAALRNISGSDFDSAPVFQSLSLFFAFTVVGVLESTDPEGARAATEAAMKGGSFYSLRFNKTIDLAGFGAYYQANPAPWKFEPMRRYIDHLIFRTFLADREPVLHRLTALYMAASLLDFYLYLSAWQAGKPSPAEEDMHCALGIVEKGFTGHTTTLVPFFKGFTDGFRDQMKALL
ncbi:MAG: YkgJ family cysteine cluster protein [Vulcanimicrobiota bacterium]